METQTKDLRELKLWSGDTLRLTVDEYHLSINITVPVTNTNKGGHCDPDLIMNKIQRTHRYRDKDRVFVSYF